eukprot:PhF_6_TR13003/c5_g1_i1/m.20594
MTKMVDDDGKSALYEAAFNGHADCIRRLLAVDPSMTNIMCKVRRTLFMIADGISALHVAAMRGHDVCVRALLSVNPSMTKMVSNDGSSALHLATRNGHADCIRTLMVMTETVNRKDVISTLHEAANNGHDVRRLPLDGDQQRRDLRISWRSYNKSQKTNGSQIKYR